MAASQRESGRRRTGYRESERETKGGVAGVAGE